MSTGTESGKALILRDIRKNYQTGSGELQVLKGISFSVDKGEFLGIMGSSGSGKSTLLNTLGLLDVPSSGDYILDGHEVSRLSDRELTDTRNRKIGYIFQSFYLFSHLTVRQNIEVPMIYAGRRKLYRREVAARMAQQVGLGHRLDHRPTQLSGGECQRVAIARALVNHPTFLLADEPTGNLDEKTGTGIMELFHRLHDSGVTIVMVTHNPQYESVFDRVVVLRNGLVWKEINNLTGERKEFAVS